MTHRLLPHLLGASVLAACVAEPGSIGDTDPWHEQDHDHGEHEDHLLEELPEVAIVPTCVDLSDPGRDLDYCLRLSPEEPDLPEDEPRFDDLEGGRLPTPMSGQGAARCGTFNLVGGPAMRAAGDDVLLAYCDQDLIGGTRLVQISANGLPTSMMVKERACMAAPAGVALGGTDTTELLFTTPSVFAAPISDDGVPGLHEDLGHEDTFGVAFLGGRRLQASTGGTLTDLDTGELLATNAEAWGTGEDGLVATCTDGLLQVRATDGSWARAAADTACRPFSPIWVASSHGAVAVAFRSQGATGRLFLWDGSDTTDVTLGDYPVVAPHPDGFVTVDADARLVRWDPSGEVLAEREHPHVASAHHVEHLNLIVVEGDAHLAMIDRRYWADDRHYYAYDLLEVSRMAVP